MSIGKSSFTIDVAERVSTTDERAHVFATGFTIQRPNDVRGDSVNQLMIGGRCDILTEALDERRAKADREAVSMLNAEIAEAQAIHGVPVTEPVIAVAS
jgi:hypothetical protein